MLCLQTEHNGRFAICITVPARLTALTRYSSDPHSQLCPGCMRIPPNKRSGDLIGDCRTAAPINY